MSENNNKMDMALDDIIMQDRPSKPRRFDNRSRGNRSQSRFNPYNRKQTSYRDLDRPDTDSQWTHDKYEIENGGDLRSLVPKEKRENRQERRDEEMQVDTVSEPTRVIKAEDIHWNLSEKDIREIFE